MPAVPESRVRRGNTAPIRPDGEIVLYWMTATRRTRSNFGLQRAVEHCRQLGRPLVVLEGLRCDYRWASDRFHRFVLDGMRDNTKDLAAAGVAYHPYVEPAPGHGRGLLEAMARRAAVVVTDEFPCFFLPRMVAAAGERLDVALEVVDSNGLLPLAATEQIFTTAHSFRRFLQKTLKRHLDETPAAHPLARAKLPSGEIPAEVLRRWPAADAALLSGRRGLGDLPIDHAVPAVAFAGGAASGTKRLRAFVDARLDSYGGDRNHPDSDGSSGLAPYLHFGHVSAHDVLRAVARHEGWTHEAVSDRKDGKRTGWWGMSGSAEAFMDQLVTWREVGFNRCANSDGYDEYHTLPGWAQTTLAEHESDPRPHLYTLDQLESAETHDEVWNAAQRELLQEGRIHNYLRMLWGKRILEWSETPRQAAATMIDLNDKLALDGRDPNSYSGIFWVLGRYDRAWGPERPIFGKVRYMSSDNTRRKLNLKRYLERFAEDAPGDT